MTEKDRPAGAPENEGPDSTDGVRAARDRLVEATVRHVPFDGWTPAALRAGAKDCGLDADAVSRLLPGGVADAIAAFSRLADRRMAEAVAAADIADMRIRERIAFAVRARLAFLEPHREAVRRGLSWLAMPHNALLGARLLYRTVDDVWYAIGDRSADFSFYTRRGLLAGVVGSTTLFWLDDRSADGSETDAFLDRRIADALRLGSLKAGSLLRRADPAGGGAGGGMPNPLRAFRDVVRRRYGVPRPGGDSRVT